MRTNRNNTMYCPQEKALQMSRTLLAANRNAARTARQNKRKWHGRRRAARRTEEHLYEGVSVDNALEMIEDFEENEITRVSKAIAKSESDRKYDVFDRREGDRLGLYFRWAEKVTDHLDTPDERMNYIAENTPDDPYLISHALLHLSFTNKFSHNNYVWFSPEWYARQREARNKRDAHRTHIKKLIRIALMRVIEHNKHHEFNKIIKRYEYIRTNYLGEIKERRKMIRPFEGLHDLEDYTEEVYKASFMHSYTKAPKDERVLRALEQCGEIKIY